MHQSPLHSFHLQHGAKMIDFAGWSMPVHYRSIIEEHKYTREACSLFDVSHMGRLRVSGDDAEALLQYVCTRDVGDMPPGLSRYTHVCREDGGILDDVIVSRYPDDYLVVCNASNREKILAWLNQHAAGRKVAIDDQTRSTAMVALQGPEALPRIQKLLNVDLSGLKRYHFLSQVYVTFRYSIFRSGYTGEDGVEIILPVSLVKLALPAIMGLGDDRDDVIKPAGLGARDSLRLEAGMPLYGHELNEDWDSLTAGQAWCVHLDKGEFVGAAELRRLKAEGLKRRLVGLELAGRRTARPGHKILAGPVVVGTVTSGALSPTLGKSIAMGLVDVAHAEEQTRLAVDLGSNKEIEATVVRLPFYKRAR